MSENATYHFSYLVDKNFEKDLIMGILQLQNEYSSILKQTSSHPGLVQRTVTVHPTEPGKKPFTRRQWVRPEEANETYEPFRRIVPGQLRGKYEKPAMEERNVHGLEDIKWIRPSKGQTHTLGDILIPSGWTDIWISPDKDAPVQAIGKDSKGRTQYIRSAKSSEEAAAVKFTRIRDFTQYLPGMLSQIKKDLNKNEAARIAYLISQTLFRVGGLRETFGDVTAHGASTLLPEHIKIDGTNISFDFIGKKGVRQQKTVDDPLLSKILYQQIKGKHKGERIFSASDLDVRRYMESISPVGKSFYAKDFRTAGATNIAISEIEQMPIPQTKREYNNFRNQVATVVSKELGNSPAIALKDYIAPEVFDSWRVSLAQNGIIITKEYLDFDNEDDEEGEEDE